VEGLPDNANVHFYLGVALQALGQLDLAVASYQRTIEIKSDHEEASNNLGNALKDLGRLDEAVASYRRALTVRPDFAEAHNNFGIVLQDLGRFDEAVASYCRALEIKPNYVKAHYNLGNILTGMGRFDDAVASYRRALDIEPSFHLATANLGFALLALGRYRDGWPCYEARTILEDKRIFTAPNLPFPSWRGEPLVGRSIIIVGEQGIGDGIQFCRYASNLKERGAAHVTLACQNRLRPLFSRIKGIDSVIDRSDITALKPHDFWVYAQSLPLHFDTTVDTVPAAVPYLFADAALTERFASEFDQSAGLKIGICWKGSATYKWDAERSPGLGFFSPIFGIDGVRIYTLLPNSRAELNVSAKGKAVDIGHEIDEFTAPFEETAALIMNLDLVITSDTSICHLAGALGKPVWLVLPYVAHWVWMTDREDNPWYPNTRLFRQTERGNWAEVFERVAHKIKAVLAEDMSLLWPKE